MLQTGQITQRAKDPRNKPMNRLQSELARALETYTDRPTVENGQACYDAREALLEAARRQMEDEAVEHRTLAELLGWTLENAGHPTLWTLRNTRTNETTPTTFSPTGTGDEAWWTAPDYLGDADLTLAAIPSDACLTHHETVSYVHGEKRPFHTGTGTADWYRHRNPRARAIARALTEYIQAEIKEGRWSL